MHAVAALEERGERGIREMVLHFQKMNQLGHYAALLNNGVKVVVGVLDELLNCLLVSEHTVLFVVLEHTQVGLARHEQALLHDVHETEAEEVEWNVHEVWRVEGHLTNDVVTHDFRLHGLRDVLLDKAKLCGLLCVESLTLPDECLRQLICHVLFVFKQHIEQVLAQHCQILLLKKLGVDL